MAAPTSPSLKSSQPNRRRRVRHRVQTPAYASFSADAKNPMLELHEIIDISEDGVAIQCHTLLENGQRVNLCLDLSECSDHIYTTGQVIWSNTSGRTGLRFAELRPLSLLRLREWLFLNAMSSAANAEDLSVSFGGPALSASDHPPIRTSHSDKLAAVNAVQREVEAVGRDLSSALKLLAARAQTLVHASGAAIALTDKDPAFLVCRASSGPDAPPVGARLQSGSGFSGECVRTGTLLRCDDAEIDLRADRESCRALGIRSMLAVPIRVGEKSIGILEVFSAQANAFSESDSRVLQRLAETVLAAVNRAARAESLPELQSDAPSKAFSAPPGSVLFAAKTGQKEEPKNPEEKSSGGISLPRSLLFLLIAAAATIFGVLGYTSAPLVQKKLQERGPARMQSVLASSSAPPATAAASPSVDMATVDQLKEMAGKGDAAAQNLLGLHYVSGEGVKQDEREAVRWFTKAAEQGNVSAQSKLGSIYFRGRDVPQNLNQAYFWMVLARANGDENSKVLAPLVAARLTRAQVTSIELDASRWLDRHNSTTKPSASR
jgi:putative methionine-R-sulfoxide reductase with GAF domain